MAERNRGLERLYPSKILDRELYTAIRKQGKDSLEATNLASNHSGVSKREHFAALAMQGLLANPNIHAWGESEATMATQAVRCADALLDALK